MSSSVTSRRFPALRTLTVDDVEVMVMPPSPTGSTKMAASKPLIDPNLVKPSAVESLGGARQTKGAPMSSSAMKAAQERPPFRPCNPTEAKETITELRHGYVGIHSPYDLAHKLQEIERAEANKHIISDAVYMPNAWSQARKTIEINYFLNSPDAETIEAERRYAPRHATPRRLPRHRHAARRMPRSLVGLFAWPVCALYRYIQDKAQRNMIEYYRRLRPNAGPMS